MKRILGNTQLRTHYGRDGILFCMASKSGNYLRQLSLDSSYNHEVSCGNYTTEPTAKKWYSRLKHFIEHNMTLLGVALIGIAGALIGVYAAKISNSVRLPISDLMLWGTIIILFISGLSLAIVGIVRTWGNFTPRQRKRNERLRVHFDDMLAVLPQIIPSLVRNEGRIDIRSDNKTSYKIAANSLRKFADDYAIHFTKESKIWDTLSKVIDIQNAEYLNFQSRVGESFKLDDLEIRIDSIDSMDKSTYIEEAFFHTFFIWCRDRLNQSKYPQINFEKFEFINADLGLTAIRVNGYAGNIAYATNETDRDKCVRVIQNIVKQYEVEATKLTKSADDLLESVYNLHVKISDMMSNVDKYWPGTKDYKFSRMKLCPTCRVI